MCRGSPKRRMVSKYDKFLRVHLGPSSRAVQLEHVSERFKEKIEINLRKTCAFLFVTCKERRHETVATIEPIGYNIFTPHRTLFTCVALISDGSANYSNFFDNNRIK